MLPKMADVEGDRLSFLFPPPPVFPSDHRFRRCGIVPPVGKKGGGDVLQPFDFEERIGGSIVLARLLAGRWAWCLVFEVVLKFLRRWVMGGFFAPG